MWWMAAGSKPTELTVVAWSGWSLEEANPLDARRWLSPRTPPPTTVRAGGIVALVLAR